MDCRGSSCFQHYQSFPVACLHHLHHFSHRDAITSPSLPSLLGYHASGRSRGGGGQDPPDVSHRLSQRAPTAPPPQLLQYQHCWVTESTHCPSPPTTTISALLGHREHPLPLPPNYYNISIVGSQRAPTAPPPNYYNISIVGSPTAPPPQLLQYQHC